MEKAGQGIGKVNGLCTFPSTIIPSYLVYSDIALIPGLQWWVLRSVPVL